MFTVIGTATVDLFVSNLAAMPRSEGDEFTVDSLVFHDDPLRTSLGGNGANSACALARLGAPVELVGGLGQDHLGDWMAAQLADVGVGMANVRRYPGMGTATTLILSDAQQNRTAFHHPGANNAVAAIDENLVRRSDILLLTSYSIMPGLRPRGALDLFRNARNSGTRTAVDIGPAIGEPPSLDELRPLLPHIDYFICNEHELDVATGGVELAAGMAAILEGGAGCVVIKRGAAGAVVFARAEREATARRPREPTETPGFAVEVHTTVGAGDSFNAGFLLAVEEGASPEQAARFANAVAAIVVSTPGRPLDALSRQSVNRLLDSTPAR